MVVAENQNLQTGDSFKIILKQIAWCFQMVIDKDFKKQY
jgi:hypothetical protein